MSSSTNTSINSRSMNGVITITDGFATLENGALNCDGINSDNLVVNSLDVNTGTITTLSNSNLINCTTTTTPVNPNDITNKYYVHLKAISFDLLMLPHVSW